MKELLFNTTGISYLITILVVMMISPKSKRAGNVVIAVIVSALALALRYVMSYMLFSFIDSKFKLEVGIGITLALIIDFFVNAICISVVIFLLQRSLEQKLGRWSDMISLLALIVYMIIDAKATMYVAKAVEQVFNQKVAFLDKFTEMTQRNVLGHYIMIGLLFLMVAPFWIDALIKSKQEES